MNLKEAFRYQNFLDRVFTQVASAMIYPDNLLQVTKNHMRSKAISSAEDETEKVEVPELICPKAAVTLALQIIDEREKLTTAIGAAKQSLPGELADMDAAIEANKYRQLAAERIRMMLKTKAGKRVEKGTGYTFNSEGNQVSYYYDVEVSTEERFDREKMKSIMQDLLKKSDQVSVQIDEAVVNTKVEYEAPWDVNTSLEDLIAKIKE